MDTESAPVTGDVLQFDRAIPAVAEAADGQAAPGVACTSCRTQLTREYYDVNGKPACETCRDAVMRQAAPVTEGKLLLRAAAYGLAAAIAGAIVYYGVIAITDFEIGLVAILIGWMVGKALSKATRGRGGRRLQVLAIALTYFSVALAYLPLAMKGETERRAAKPAAVADSAASAPRAATASAETASAETASAATASAATAPGDSLAAVDGGDAALAFGMLLLITLALPVLVVFGSMPGGILSAVIIGVGMHQAWRMTAAPEVKVRGPLRVGGPPPAAPERPDAA